MPIAYLDVPPGLGDGEAKATLFPEVYEALEEPYPPIGDSRIFLREWPHESVSQNGRLDADPPRPVAFLECPPRITTEEKRTMFGRISAAVTATYGLHYVAIFLREYPVANVGLDGVLQSENPVLQQDTGQAEERA
jgi:hypothetical protein